MFRNGCTGMQTNGTLIDDEHIEMFKTYRAGIGVSIDGPGQLNDYRMNADQTDLVIGNIGAMRKHGIAVSVISVMHDLNCTGAGLQKFKEFGEWLYMIGIPNVNCHFMQGGKESYVEGFLELAEWLKDRPHLRWQPFLDMTNLLAGRRDNVLCLWRGCDPYNTTAVQSVENDGSLSNCGRLTGSGPNWLKSRQESAQTRQQSLAQTPQEYGGCKGCRFLSVCSGGCPGEAIDGDWRNRTTHCRTIKALFRFYEDAMLDQEMVPATVPKAQQQKCEQGQEQGHGDVSHQDRPHQDAHEDHYDSAQAEGRSR